MSLHKNILTNNKNKKMKILLIWGETCSRCRFIEPHLKAFAEKNWYEFEEKNIEQASPEEIEWATSLPIIWIDWKQMDYDEVIAMLSN